MEDKWAVLMVSAVYNLHVHSSIGSFTQLKKKGTPRCHVEETCFSGVATLRTTYFFLLSFFLFWPPGESLSSGQVQDKTSNEERETMIKSEEGEGADSMMSTFCEQCLLRLPEPAHVLLIKVVGVGILSLELEES